MLIDFENKIFEGSDGRKSLFDFQLPEQAKGVLIFMHGYKGYKDWGAWPLMQNYFVSQGYGFVKFNVTHNGGTVDNPIDFDDLEAFGRNTYSKELFDLLTIIDETERIVKEECELDLPLYLLGHSRGGGMVILGGSEHPKIKGIVSLAGISVIENRFPEGDPLREWERTGVIYVRNARTNQDMPHFYSFYEDFVHYKSLLNIESAATAINVPFLQIHGDMDLTVSISEGQKIAEWTDTDLVIMKGADHTFGSKQPWSEEDLPEDLEVVVHEIFTFLSNIS